jgi:hypothetical protein
LDADGHAAFVRDTVPAQRPKASGYPRRIRIRTLLFVRTKKTSGLVFTHAKKGLQLGMLQQGLAMSRSLLNRER